MKFILPFLLIMLTMQTFATENLLKSEHFNDSIEGDSKVIDFEMRVEHKEVFYSFSEGKPYYHSKMVAKIQTKNPKDLEEYGVVQFIRGCIFETNKSENGTIEYSIKNSRQFFNQYISFKHPEWVIDSVDVDPVYWSGDDKTGRVGLYRLDDPMEQRYKQDSKLFHKHHTNQSQFYVRDMPTGATEFKSSHQNVSLEFKTCLYKLSDVTSVSDPRGRDIAGKELKCFNWQSNFAFNYEENKYQSKKNVNPFCLLP